MLKLFFLLLQRFKSNYPFETLQMAKGFLTPFIFPFRAGNGYNP
jgi:hypothetical protein